jgi:tocopherol cyclase
MTYYHGAKKDSAYFEGWYLKHQQGNDTIALIPAVHMDKDGEKSASIQVVTPQGAHTFPFPYSAFSAREDAFQVTIGSNCFSQDGLLLNLSSPSLTIAGSLKYGPLTPLGWDIMGPFALLSFLQCNHGVLSMGHTVRGRLLIDGTPMEFSQGVGYIETDWGRSFPREYLWTQCSHFPQRQTSVMASIAHIPLLRTSFTGCIASVYLMGREYRMASYLGAHILYWGPNGFHIRQGKYLLQGDVLSRHAHALAAPRMGAMSRTIHESPACTMRYRFSREDVPLLDFISPHASFEYAPLR